MSLLRRSWSHRNIRLFKNGMLRSLFFIATNFLENIKFHNLNEKSQTTSNESLRGKTFMRVEHDNIGLSTSEMSFLWQNYIGNTMLICVLQHFLQNIQDQEIAGIVSQGVELAKKHTEQSKELFKKEGFPIPNGFGPEDVNLEAPRLFSDKFYSYYVQQVLRGTISNYSLAFSYSHRKDVRDYFKHCIHEDTELFNKTMDVMLEKGLAYRPPGIPVPTQVDFVNNKEFLGEWFGDERPLSSTEIMSIYMNIETNILGSALMTAFSQTAQEKKLRSYFQDGLQTATSHIEKFAKVLAKDSLSIPPVWNPEVSDSTVPAFSDKLMLYHGGLATAAGIGNYGIAMASSQRRDLGLMYVKLTSEIGKYAEKGARLAIEHGWLEQPPMAIDRKELFKK
jgi:hypothetical protein